MQSNRRSNLTAARKANDTCATTAECSASFKRELFCWFQQIHIASLTCVSQAVPCCVQRYSLVYNCKIHADNIVPLAIKHKTVDEIIYFLFLSLVNVVYTFNVVQQFTEANQWKNTNNKIKFHFGLDEIVWTNKTKSCRVALAYLCKSLCLFKWVIVLTCVMIS